MKTTLGLIQPLLWQKMTFCEISCCLNFGQFVLTKTSFMPGLHQRINVTVIAATNRPDNIDPALLRPGMLCFVTLCVLLTCTNIHEGG